MKNQMVESKYVLFEQVVDQLILTIQSHGQFNERYDAYKRQMEMLQTVNETYHEKMARLEAEMEELREDYLHNAKILKKIPSAKEFSVGLLTVYDMEDGKVEDGKVEDGKIEDGEVKEDLPYPLNTCDCSVCFKTCKHDTVVMNCNHKFCHDCIVKWIKTTTVVPACPNCRTDITSLRTSDKKTFIRLQAQFTL
jgi:hypothetical protein